MTITPGGPLPLVGLIVVLGGGVAPGARGAQSASQEPPPDACARLTPAEASQVLGARVGDGQVRTHDMATECRYDTAGDEGGRLTLAFDVYETGRAGLDGSAAAYFAQVRRASGHMGLRLEAVSGVGDEAYWMRGVLNVRKGEDLALAIEVSGVGLARPDDTVGEPAVDPKTLALSKTVAAIILRQTNAASSARTGETLTIQSNTQAHLQDLTIGVGNIWEDAYTPRGRPADARANGHAADRDVGRSLSAPAPARARRSDAARGRLRDPRAVHHAGARVVDGHARACALVP